ncbi:zinc finger domain-containing protein [Mycobacterium marinum]|uniref:zinc finger domain-containing protein n=1 Tax=Mycobacterium marinum TaxID=1781 RepID=UPI00045FE7A2|nr:hypothetical protein [Mycobacterium marinum]CDM76141.1 hypothetical protein MMARE11_19940 [Mycobacterium marinum E11]
MRSKTEHPSLSHRCPFCGADPGTPCATSRGRELDWPHIRRREVAEPKPPKPVKQALCCQCGQPRTYKSVWRARGGYNPGDRWKRRWVGRLKCSHCATITTHALLVDPNSSYRDADEREQLLALGDQPRNRYEQLTDLGRLRREYRDGMPQNPNLRHIWWIRDETAARAAGAREVPTLCGGVHQLRGESASARERIKPSYLAPDPVRLEEYTDLDTGESWRDGDCVDCLRVHNAGVLERAREDLTKLISWYFVRAERLNATEVGELRTFLQEAADRTFRRWQAERQRSDQ